MFSKKYKFFKLDYIENIKLLSYEIKNNKIKDYSIDNFNEMFNIIKEKNNCNKIKHIIPYEYVTLDFICQHSPFIKTDVVNNILSMVYKEYRDVVYNNNHSTLMNTIDNKIKCNAYILEKDLSYEIKHSNNKLEYLTIIILPPFNSINNVEGYINLYNKENNSIFKLNLEDIKEYSCLIIPHNLSFQIKCIKGSYIYFETKYNLDEFILNLIKKKEEFINNTKKCLNDCIQTKKNIDLSIQSIIEQEINPNLTNIILLTSFYENPYNDNLYSIDKQAYEWFCDIYKGVKPYLTNIYNMKIVNNMFNKSLFYDENSDYYYYNFMSDIIRLPKIIRLDYYSCNPYSEYGKLLNLYKEKNEYNNEYEMCEIINFSAVVIPIQEFEN